MFNAEPLPLKVKGIKLRTDGELRFCDIRTEAEITDEIASGLPEGHRLYKALESGALKRTVLDTAALEFLLTMSAPVRDANPKSKPDVFNAKKVKVLEVPLARQDSEEGGATTVIARPLLSLRLSDNLMLYLAHHFADGDLTFKLTRQQLTLPLENPDEKDAEPAKNDAPVPPANNSDAELGKGKAKKNGKGARAAT